MSQFSYARFTLSLEDIELIVDGLGKLPHEDVHHLISDFSEVLDKMMDDAYEKYDEGGPTIIDGPSNMHLDFYEQLQKLKKNFVTNEENAMSADQVKVLKKAGFWKAKKTGKKIVAKLETADAPYGLKKDGTPAKKRGRKAS